MSIGLRRLAAVAAASCVLLAGCGAAGSAPGGSASGDASRDAVGVTTYASGNRPAVPDLAAGTLDGGRLALSSLRGHVVVLNAWASWCGPCRSESPALAQIAKSTEPLGVRFVGLDEQDLTGPARSFAHSAGTSAYPHLIDHDGHLLTSLRLVPPSGIPSTLVLDRDGRVAARVVGPIAPASFTALVRSIAAGSAVATPSTT